MACYWAAFIWALNLWCSMLRQVLTSNLATAKYSDWISNDFIILATQQPLASCTIKLIHLQTCSHQHKMLNVNGIFHQMPVTVSYCLVMPWLINQVVILYLLIIVLICTISTLWQSMTKRFYSYHSVKNIIHHFEVNIVIVEYNISRVNI